MAYYKLVTDKLLQCVEKTLVNIQCSIGANGGLATLDSTGNVPLAQLGNAPGGGGSGVTSFNTRTGVVVPLAADYKTLLFTGSTAQYTRGDGSLATFPTNVSSFTNDSGYLTSASSLAWAKITGTPTTVSGYGISDAATLTGTQTLSNKTITGYQPTISLATTGTSGAATFTSNTLTIPQYQGALSLTTTGSSGASTLVGTTLNIPSYTGGSPTGTAGQLQYTDGTNFAATSYMTYTTNLLSLSGALGIGGSGVTTSGLSLVNTTAATSSVQQVSPALVLSGRGWSTSSSASQTGLFAIYNTPVTGSAITDTLNFASSENGGTLTPRATITSAGLFTAQNIQSNGQLIAGSSVTVGTGSFITWSGSNTPLLIDGDQNGTISQRNTAIQQAYRVYNSFSTGPNGEWVELGFKTNSNIATINTAAVGTGTVRNMTISAPEISITGGLAFKRTTVADAAYSILVTDYLVAYTSLTTARTATLPTTGVTTGQVFIVKDESGNAVTSNITVAGTIDGGTNKTIALAFGSVKVYYNGSAYFTTS